MRPANQLFFVHSCIYLRILIISYLATFLGTNSLSVLMCRKAVNQSIDPHSFKANLIHSSQVFLLCLYFLHQSGTRFYKQAPFHPFLFAPSQTISNIPFSYHNCNTHITLPLIQFLNRYSILETKPSHPSNCQPLCTLLSLHVF